MKRRDFAYLGKKLVRACCPELSVKGKLLFLSPVAPILRGFCFDNSGSAAEAFYLWSLFLPLCVPTKHIQFTFGHRLGRHKRWRVDDPDLEITLISEMQRELPSLENLASLDAVIAALRSKAKPNTSNYINPMILEALAYVLILNNNPDASEVLRNIITYENSTVPWEAALGKRVVLISNRFSQGGAVAISQLREWEQESLKNLHLPQN
jgi:hypothetical protein